jgi:hypothetical protein
LSDLFAIIAHMDTARLLAARLADLLRRENAAMAEFLLALTNFDRERRWEELGYASLFDFLHRELRVSRGSAFYRSTAARLLQAFPDVAEAFRDGRLCITSVAELAKVLTPENRADVLPRFFHASKREAQAIAAELRPVPAPPRRDVVTPMARTQTATPISIPTPTPTATATATATAGVSCADAVVQPVELAIDAIARRRPDMTALGPDLCRLHITVSRAFLEKLEAALPALSHARPGPTTEDVLDAALDLVLAARDRRKGLVKRPRDPSPKHVTQPAEAVTALQETQAAADSTIPASVRREVWLRDGGCCHWVLDSGGICGSRHRLEFDHIRPRALGGASTADNLRLLCRAHNLVAARRAFGRAWMDRFTQARELVEPYGAVRIGLGPGRGPAPLPMSPV